ncbi:ureidoglycolate lyase [Jannaschia pagri]|uniref:Ureidoglycolate lyase n=1 Tax=Jannaschia pagri TaxID=2829797 RepID=A0ABQ4NM04_9RHOB|nr:MULTISPECIES: ureidoglycolate lyase [unclassified Jannaschia]GIT91603.1 ureidoglycolate lyase [Jannaschia sp. AI_61]GIT95437.1 ureidoglycolate lyase [Jannaschia sp. AI_62]
MIVPIPITEKLFAPYGTLIACAGGDARRINGGLCTRWHDRCRPDVDGAVSVSLFDAEPRSLPYTLDLIERHPKGSQAFLPMTEHPFLVIVADGPDATPKAFVTAPHQGIQFHRGTWHGVLTPLHSPGLFAVIDREQTADNLEEHHYATPWIIGS